jgi:hypothetical protein
MKIVIKDLFCSINRNNPVILIFACALLCSGCMTTKQIQKAITEHDQSIKHVEVSLILPKGITITTTHGLPKQTQTRKTYCIILPLLAIDYFQTNHKITIGQSSFERTPMEIFKSKLIAHLLLLKSPWEELERKGFRLDVKILTTESYGTFSSGYIAMFGYYSGYMGKFRVVKNVKSEIQIDFRLSQHDSLFASRTFSIFMKGSQLGRTKVVYVDSSKREKVLLPFQKNSLPQANGHTVNDLINTSQTFLEISIEETIKIITKVLENYLADFAAENQN